MNGIKVYRIVSPSKLFGFEDAFSDVSIANVPLYETQRTAFQNSEIIDLTQEEFDSSSDEDKEKSFYFSEDLFFTPELVKKLFSEAKEQKFSQSLKLCLEDNTYNERFALPHSQEASFGYDNFNMGFKVSGSKSKDWIVPQKVYPFDISAPSQMVKGGNLAYPLCDTFVTRLASPFHLLHASAAYNLGRSLRLRTKLPESWSKKYLFHGSRWFYRGLKRMNKIGKNCHIHPTAVIEGSELGDNVKVGAFTVVRLSKVASGSVIEDQCCIKYSTLAENTYIAQANQLHLCHTEPETFLIHGPYQFSIFGKSTAAMAVINCDYRLDQKNIRINSDKGLIDSRQPLLGIAYGHHSKVGGGNIIAPGRIVPNGTHCPPPDFIKLDF